MTDTKKRKIGFSSGLFVLCLCILCQPNINIIDVFPDFIAYFILAGMMGSAAAFVPYMDEAKASFTKLAFLDIFRFFCQFLVFASVNSDTQNDTMALFSLSFSVVTYIFLFKAIHDTFLALFYLGERSDCTTLIRPYSVLGITVKPEVLEMILEGFFGLKAVLAMLPEFVLLFSKTSPRLLYRNSVFIGVGLGLLSGVFTIVFACGYIRSVRSEGTFAESLKAMSESNASVTEEHGKRLTLTGAFLFMFVSTVFTAFLPIDTFDGADLFPGFFFPLLFLIGLNRLSTVTPVDRRIFGFGVPLSIVAFVSYVFRPVFFSLYDLTDIGKSHSANVLYTVYEGISLLECILNIVFLLLLAKLFDWIVQTYTGVPATATEYRQSDRDYHKSIQKLNHAAVCFGILTAVLRTVKIVTDRSSFATPIVRDSVIVGTVTMSAIPWIGMVVNVTAVLFTVLFYYFSSTLKEEWNL